MALQALDQPGRAAQQVAAETSINESGSRPVLASSVSATVTRRAISRMVSGSSAIRGLS